MHYKSLCLICLIMSCHLRADLIADVAEETVGTVWSYTLFNNEPANSPNFISSFSLAVNAPITIIDTPAGWDFSTDGATFVFWFNTDVALPYPNDVAPGMSLAGFSLISPGSSSQLLSYGLSGWGHAADQPGPTTGGSVFAPSTSAIPEPASAIMLCGGLVLALVRYCVRRYY